VVILKLREAVEEVVSKVEGEVLLVEIIEEDQIVEEVVLIEVDEEEEGQTEEVEDQTEEGTVDAGGHPIGVEIMIIIIAEEAVEDIEVVDREENENI
jgi:hypothetical protein